MGRFNFEAYDKLFPREPEPVHVESAVDNFTPTKNKVEGKDPDEIDEPEEAKKDLLIEDADPVPDLEEVFEDGHAEHSKSDTE